MYQLDRQLRALDGSRRQDAVAEIEDVSGDSPASLFEHAHDTLLQLRVGQKPAGGSEVSLQGDARSDAAPGFVERDAPVDSRHVRAGAGHLVEQLLRLVAVHDQRTLA